MIQPQLKIREFKSLEDFLSWWNSPEVAQFRRTHPDMLNMLDEHRWVIPWLTKLQKEGKAIAPMHDKKFGKYILKKKLGEGGMGIVYLALDPDLNRKVALKMIPLKDKDSMERFDREARAVAKLKHPNIIPIYEIGLIEQYHYFTMEYIEGESLDKLVENKERHLGHRQVAEIIYEIASALHYAHSQQIIHRDIKPANILIDTDDKAYLTDFGLAKELQGLEKSLTLSGTIIGTPDYMSPEQARGAKRKIDQRSDIFSLGATLYYGLTGRPPFRGKELYQVLEAVVNKDPIPPRRIMPRIPQDMETICLKCLEKEPERRYQDDEELIQDLRRYLAGVVIHAKPAGLVTKSWRMAMQNKIAIWSLIGAAVIILAIVISLAIVSAAKKHQAAAYSKEAHQKFDKKQFADAATLCNRILALEPDNEEIQSLLGWCNNKIKAKAKAEQEARKTAEQEAKKVEEIANKLKHEAEIRAHETEIRAKAKGVLDRTISLTKPQDKITAAEDALKIDPSFGDAYQVIGYAYKDLKDYKKAIEYFSKAITNTPTLVYSYYERGIILYFIHNDIAGAVNDFSKVTELDPNSHLGYFAKGVVECERKNYEQSLANFNRAIELKTDFAQAYSSRGVVYSMKGDFERAISDFNKAIEFRSNYAVTYYNRGIAYHMKRDLERAIADFNKAIELQPNFAYAYGYRGIVYDNKGDLERAMADYNKAIELQPNLAEAYHNRGYTYYKKGDLERAIADFNKAIELQPNYAGAYYGRGIIYGKKGDLERAISEFNKAIELQPNFAEAYYSRGITYYNKGDWALAITDLESFLKLDPNNSNAATARKLIEEAKKQQNKGK
jgi:tetratricopeptide (TPR) repeat protein/predicted Ser/Thr protein kinase